MRSEHIGGGFGGKGLRAHQVSDVMRAVMTRRQAASPTGYRSPIGIAVCGPGERRVLDIADALHR